MPTTTWLAARREIARPLGLVDGLPTTTNVTTNTSIVSTELSRRWPNDDYFNGWFSAIVIDVDGSSPANGRSSAIRRVTDYTGSSGTLTGVTPNYLTEDEAVYFDLYRFHPDDIRRAYNRARQNVFPQIGIVRDLETVVSGVLQTAYTIPSTIRRIQHISLGQKYEPENFAENLLLNAGFEAWTNATPPQPPNWSIAGAGASVNQEEATADATNYAVLSGSNSARIVVPSTTVTTLLQTFDVSSSDYAAVGTEGMECNVSAWVYCNTASRVSVQIAGTDGSTHGGTGWERITASVDLGATATTAAVGISVTSGDAIPVFVDHIIMTLGPSEVIERPYAPIENWQYVGPVAGASNGGVVRFYGHLPPLHRIRIVGMDMLSSVSGDTSTIEIDGELLEPVYNLTRSMLCRERAYERPGPPDSDWLARSREFEAEYDNAINNGIGARLWPNQQLRRPDAGY
tara:strand:- start:1906 stop:3279 length:1374 start_codon:yes stop_codon:yes gene_type:complete